MTLAIVRAVPDSINECQLTHRGREGIDLGLARRQHEEYVRALEELGAQIRELAPMHDAPDSVFVEDAAVVLDEVAIITRPGAPSRRTEVPTVAELLGEYRTCEHIREPALLDGGDVVVLGRRVFVGRSSRSNGHAFDSLRRILDRFGYSLTLAPITSCLHLKSAATAIADDTILVNPAWVDPTCFEPCRTIEVHPDEPDAANAVRVGMVLLHAAEFPRTRDRLESAGFAVRPVPASELAKAEGSLTCCSLILDSV